MVIASPARLMACVLVGAGVLVGVAGLSTDATGRLLALPAALLLAALGARDLLLRPVLRADDDGLDVVVGLHRRRVGWAEVERMRVVTDRRTPLLEIDLADTLVVLSRSRLGRPPGVVLDELLALQR